MAGENGPVFETTIPASADLSSFQYRAVFINSSGSAGTFTEAGGTAGTPPIGILTNKPAAAGRGARVAMQGITKMEAAMAINPGDVVVAKQAGRGSALSAGGSVAGTGWAVGIAKGVAAASGDIFDIYVNPFFFSRA